MQSWTDITDSVKPFASLEVPTNGDNPWLVAGEIPLEAD
jgi:hypothetical protein